SNGLPVRWPAAWPEMHVQPRKVVTSNGQQETDERFPRPPGPQGVERRRHGTGEARDVDPEDGPAKPALLGSDRPGRGGERGEDILHVRQHASDGGAERKAA